MSTDLDSQFLAMGLTGLLRMAAMAVEAGRFREALTFVGRVASELEAVAGE